MTNYLYTLPNATTGLDDVMVQTVVAVPSFAPLILIFVWLFVFIGGVLSNRNRLGTEDAPHWAVLSSLTTLMVALLMTTKAGLINLTTLGVTVAVTILTAIWYFFSKGRYDTV